MTTNSPIDAIVLGGGPGGLTAALTLARQLHSCVVFDSKSYRNAGSTWMHTVLTWDHKAPQEFRQAARENILTQYDTVEFKDLAVSNLERTEDGLFKAIDTEGGSTIGRKVILATGATDLFPDISGYEDCGVKGM